MLYLQTMKSVLITGATGGIGLAIATAYAKLGYAITFNSIEPNAATIAEEVATKYKVPYYFSNANALDKEATIAMVQEHIATFNGIDVLVLNAGIQHVAPVQNFAQEKWDAIIGINLTAAFVTTKAAWPTMQAQNKGCIINIASVHGLVASANKSAYVAAKHGLIGLTKTLALEGAPNKITCNAICPGYVLTPIVQKQIPEQMQVHNMSEADVITKILLEKHAIKEFINIDAIAAMCVHLSSDNGKYITGTAIPIDAGWTAT